MTSKDFELTEEVIDKLYDIFGIHDLKHGEWTEALFWAQTVYPDIDKYTVNTVFDDFIRDNPG